MELARPLREKALVAGLKTGSPLNMSGGGRRYVRACVVVATHIHIHTHEFKLNNDWLVTLNVNRRHGLQNDEVAAGL